MWLTCVAAALSACSAPTQPATEAAPPPTPTTPQVTPSTSPSVANSPHALPYNPGGKALTDMGPASFVGSVPAALVDPDKKVMYLTFDDGPDPVYTPQILELLKKHNAKATFFVLGKAVERHPDIMTDIKTAGHAIGNHTYNHDNLTKISAEAVAQQMTRTDAAIGAVTTCMRPPYGATNKRVRNQLTQMNKWILHWDLGSGDWQRKTAQEISATLTSGAKNGALTLMHDGGGKRDATVAGVTDAVAKLAAAGWTFEVLPMCQLLENT